MRDLLFLCHRIPYPPDKGEKIRAWHLLRGLAGCYRVHLGAFVDDPEDWAGREALERVCAEVMLLPLDRRLGRLRALAAMPRGQSLSVAFYRDRRMQRWVDGKLAEGMDGVFAYASTMAQYLPSRLAGEASLHPDPTADGSGKEPLPPVGGAPPRRIPAGPAEVRGEGAAPTGRDQAAGAPTPPVGGAPPRRSPEDPREVRGEGAAPTGRDQVAGAPAPPVGGAPPRRIPGSIIADFVDVDSEKWRQYGAAGGALGWLYRLEGRRLAAFERERAAQADHTLLVTESERNCFLGIAPGLADRVHAVPNGVDTAYFSPGQPHEDPFGGVPTLVFTGAMDYRPNVEAVTGFVRDVFPGIRRQRPDVRFCIVGLRPSPAVQALAKVEGITVTGRVPDVRPYLANAAAVVAPLTIARGVQNKVLEAMAMGRPVVCTPQALEGIAAEHGREVLVAEMPAAKSPHPSPPTPSAGEGGERFADVVLALLDDGQRAGALGRTAADYVRQHHGWAASVKRVEALLSSAGAAPSPRTAAGSEPRGEARRGCPSHDGERSPLAVGGTRPRRSPASGSEPRGELWRGRPCHDGEKPFLPVGGAPPRRSPAEGAAPDGDRREGMPPAGKSEPASPAGGVPSRRPHVATDADRGENAPPTGERESASAAGAQRRCAISPTGGGHRQ